MMARSHKNEKKPDTWICNSLALSLICWWVSVSVTGQEHSQTDPDPQETLKYINQSINQSIKSNKTLKTKELKYHQ